MKLFAIENCVLAKMLRAVAKIVNVPLELHSLSEHDALSKENKAKFTRYPALVIPGKEGAEELIISEGTAVARHLVRNHPLYKHADDVVMAQIDSWLELFKWEVLDAFYMKVMYPLVGKLPYTNKTLAEGNAAFKSFLAKINQKMGDFLVGKDLTIADFYAAALLFLPMEMVLDEVSRKTFGKISQWFEKVSKNPAFLEFFGPCRYAKAVMKPWLPPKEEGEASEEKKVKEAKPKAEHAEKAEKKEADEGEDEKEVKTKNPLDMLPPSSFDLDTFKREFLANKVPADRRKYLTEQFWNKFDASGWALWYMDYIKAEGEGQKMVQTSNLLAGYLWRIDNMGRYGFGIHGIFGLEPTLEIRGAYLLRGTEVPFFLKEHPSFEYYKTRKLDPSKPEDRKLIEDFWCSDEDEMVLDLKYREGKYFR